MGSSRKGRARGKHAKKAAAPLGAVVVGQRVKDARVGSAFHGCAGKVEVVEGAHAFVMFDHKAASVKIAVADLVAE